MRKLVSVLVAILTFSIISFGQQSSDSLPVSVLKQSLAVMGGTTPADSSASGALQIATGSTPLSATFKVTTRGMNQSREVVNAPNGTQDHVYSAGQGSTVADAAVRPVSLEQACSYQSVLFPLPILQAALSDPDTVFAYIGMETLAGTPTIHVRYWSSYASQRKNLTVLSPFSIKDVWLDSTTLLPRRISFDSRAAVGAAPSTHIDVDFAHFQSFSGTLYPTSITQSLNGTVWATYSVQSVAFNVGLTDTDFPVQ